jgi:hypothetical protein
VRKSNIISASLLIVFSLVMIFQLIPEYCSDGFGSGVPPATLPYVLCWTILICSVLLLVLNLVAAAKAGDVAPISAQGWLSLFSMAALLFFSLILMLLLGYMAGGACIIALFLVFLRTKPSVPFVLTALAVPLCLYLGLTYGLGAPMPQAELSFLRF